ncbi:unnamed protein product [Amaranthus hypochondriacus]
MAIKLAPLVVFNRVSKWVFPVKHICSLSSVIHAENCPKSYQKVLNRSEIDPRIQYLKNGLCPDKLIKVLDSISDLNSAIKVFKWASLQKQFRHTATTYSRIILKLGFAGNLDEMEGFCRAMVQDRCEGAEVVLSELMDVFVGNGRLDEASRVILVMNSSGYKLCIAKWNDVLRALVEEKREFRDVLFIYKEMVKAGILPSVDTLNYLIKSLFDANMVDNALVQFKKIKKKGCVPNCRTFEIVVHGLLAANLVEEAVGVTNEMFESGVKPDLKFYTNIIPLFCKENKPEKALRLFNMMETSEFEPDFCIYSSLIKCLCTNLCLDIAIELFNEMGNTKISPSTEVLVDILNACCKLGKLDQARTLLDNIDNKVVGPSPYNVLLQGYCDAHCLLDAIDLVDRMLHLEVADHLSWNVLIRGFCNINYVKQAYEILGKMITLSHVPDSSTYSALVIGKCNLNKYEDALELFQQVCEKDLILDFNSYDKLIRGLCDVNKFQEASKVFIYMSSRSSAISSCSFSSLIKGFCSAGRVDEAIRLLNIGLHCKNPVDTCTYSAIMYGLLRLNRLSEALAFFSQIFRRGLALDVHAYCRLIWCMVALCETNYCVLLLNEMVDESSQPDCETIASALSHLADQSQLHKIWMTIRKLCHESEVIDPKTYNLLINGLCKEGYKTEACELVDLMLEKGWVPDASTHGWLIGSITRQNAELQLSESDNSVMQDEVSSILSEELGEA